MRAAGLPVPARDARQAMRNVFYLYIKGGWVEQIEPAARQHSLPSAWTCARRLLDAARLAHLRFANLTHAA
jgi:hypothetical protein